MSIDKRLEALGIQLPPATPPAAAFVPWVRSGDLVFISGHIARRAGRPWVGKLGAGVGLQEGIDAARAVAIDLMGTLQAAAGDLDAVEQIVKLTVLVNSAPDFIQPHVVANGASELLVEVFGAAGPHARSAYCIAQAPFGACVEIELIARVRREP
jgi:enamine deaminase RidA (YjgF/YER057c/UK114 family)